MLYIKKSIEKDMKFYENNGEKIVVLDVFILIENNFYEEMDYVIFVCVDKLV